MCLGLLSCVQLCNPLDCSPPGSSVHGILQARILKWVAMPSSRRSSQPRDWIQVSCIAGGLFTDWATRDKRLINKTQLSAALIHPPPQVDPGGLRRLGRMTRSRLGLNECAFCQEEGHCRGNGLTALLWDARGAASSSPAPCEHLHADWWGPRASLAPDPPGFILLSPVGAWVTLKVAGRRTEFLVDTGAACSIQTRPAGLSNRDY